MGMFSHLVMIHREAFALLLGFTLAAFVCLIFMAGRGKFNRYDGTGIEPIDNYGDWVTEGHGRVPLFLKLWMIAILGVALSLTGIVIYHGYRY